MAEAGGVVGPVGILRVIGDPGSTVLALDMTISRYYVINTHFLGAARPIVASTEDVHSIEMRGAGVRNSLKFLVGPRNLGGPCGRNSRVLDFDSNITLKVHF
jgi:hypothetical protein